MPKYFYGDSLWLLELFQSNNWNILSIILEYFSEYGFYRIFGIIVNYFFYAASFGNITIILALQGFLLISLIIIFSSKITSNIKMPLLVTVVFTAIPFSLNGIIQPISFHQIVSLYLILYFLFAFIFSEDGEKRRPLKIKHYFALSISIFTYEIGLLLIVIPLFLFYKKNKVSSKNIIYILGSITLVALILINPKTTFIPVADHAQSSLAFQIKRYLLYGIYYMRYIFLNTFHSANIIYTILLSAATVILFLLNSKIKNLKIMLANKARFYISILLLSAIWLYFPFFSGFIQIPRLNTMITYGIVIAFFILTYNFNLNKIKSKRIILILLIFLNHSIYLVHIDGINKNFKEANMILSLIDKNEKYDNIVLNDYENINYFRRYSTKFHSLPVFIFEINSDPNTNVITSSNFKISTKKNNIFINIENGKFSLAEKAMNSSKDKLDKYAIKFFNNKLGFNYMRSQIFLDNI